MAKPYFKPHKGKTLKSQLLKKLSIKFYETQDLSSPNGKPKLLFNDYSWHFFFSSQLPRGTVTYQIRWPFHGSWIYEPSIFLQEIFFVLFFCDWNQNRQKNDDLTCFLTNKKDTLQPIKNNKNVSLKKIVDSQILD